WSREGTETPGRTKKPFGGRHSLPPGVLLVALVDQLGHPVSVDLQTGTVEGGHNALVDRAGNTEALGIDSAVPLGCSGAVGEVHQALNRPHSLRSGILDALSPVLHQGTTGIGRVTPATERAFLRRREREEP